MLPKITPSPPESGLAAAARSSGAAQAHKEHMHEKSNDATSWRGRGAPPRRTQWLPYAAPVLTLLLCRAASADTATPAAKIDTGDTAWMLTSAAFVLLMTPALAFFYAGMVRQKNALNTLMLSFSAA